MVGHLREEKDPRTYFRAAARLVSRSDLRFVAWDCALAPGRDGPVEGSIRTHCCGTRPSLICE
jgi:hypothetical protein